MKEGILMEKRKLARELILANVIPVQQIVHITGLTEQEVQVLIHQGKEP